MRRRWRVRFDCSDRTREWSDTDGAPWNFADDIAEEAVRSATLVVDVVTDALHAAADALGENAHRHARRGWRRRRWHGRPRFEEDFPR